MNGRKHQNKDKIKKEEWHHVNENLRHQSHKLWNLWINGHKSKKSKDREGYDNHREQINFRYILHVGQILVIRIRIHSITRKNPCSYSKINDIYCVKDSVNHILKVFGIILDDSIYVLLAGFFYFYQLNHERYKKHSSAWCHDYSYFQHHLIISVIQLLLVIWIVFV